VAIAEEDHEIVLAVSDNGQGIAAQYHEQIFNMYFRGSENSKGNGLGLYIVKKATEKLKGRIVFESVFNEGSTFKIILPNGIT
jgi:signal transduction histidine kinase